LAQFEGRACSWRGAVAGSFLRAHRGERAVGGGGVPSAGWIPLAIELAAARVKALPVEQIEARLEDRSGC